MTKLESEISLKNTILDPENDVFDVKMEIRALLKAKLSADSMLMVVFVSNFVEFYFMIKNRRFWLKSGHFELF